MYRMRHSLKTVDMDVHCLTPTVKPLSIICERRQEINEKLEKIIITGNLFIWAMYREKRK
jgi:hypothetical protein